MVTAVYAHTFDDNRRSLASLMDSQFFESHAVPETAERQDEPEVDELRRLLEEKPAIVKNLLELLKSM